MLRLRPGLLVPAAVLALGTLLATPAGAAPAEDASVLDSYVALGDSFSAGPLAAQADGATAGCLRSDRNFPSLVAERGGVPELIDVSCSGATTADLFAPRVTPLGTFPPQLDALDGDTEGVTLTLGAEDVGLLDALAGCAAGSCGDSPSGIGERVEETAPRIGAVLAAIAERAPDARVLVVGYPEVLPGSGPGCAPFRPADDLRAAQTALNAMLEQQADAAGAEFVDTRDRFVGHDLCQGPGARWVQGPSAAGPVHPTEQGAVELAGEVLAALDADAARPGSARRSS